MRLRLLRHGQAENSAPSDAARALTEVGRDEVRRSAARLIDQPPQLILVSPYLRAQQSADVIAEVLGCTVERYTMSWLTPDSDPRQVIREVDLFHCPDILLIAHQPLLGDLAGLLIDGHRQAALALPTAALVDLEGEFLLAGGMSLSGLYRP